jgi:prepilin-type N-terminal cleavage/methylation domain-containing protein
MNNKHTIKGFTLLETLVSIGILALVIAGPLAAIINSSSYARQTKDTMIATYLAEEAVELLQNQYDSLSVFCKNQPADALCTPSGTETPGQIAWRVFKARIGPIAAAQSCYSPSSCSYDYIDMLGDVAASPFVRYSSSGSSCPALVNASTTDSLHNYVCQGVPSHIMGPVEAKAFTRSISIEDVLAPFDPVGGEYNDDLRVTVDVQFKGVNQFMHSVKIISFMHARP